MVQANDPIAQRKIADLHRLVHELKAQVGQMQERINELESRPVPRGPGRPRKDEVRAAV